jgi:hypothetical protein
MISVVNPDFGWPGLGNAWLQLLLQPGPVCGPTQEQHHKKETFQEEFLRILKEPRFAVRHLVAKSTDFPRSAADGTSAVRRVYFLSCGGLGA